MRIQSTLPSLATALLLTVTLTAQEATLRTEFDLDSSTRGALVAEVAAKPNHLAVVLAGPQIASGIPTPFGKLFLDPALFSVLGMFTLDGAGRGQLLLPFQLTQLTNVQFGLQAVTAGGGGKKAASEDDTVYVDHGAGFTWLSTCTMSKKDKKKGKFKISFSGKPGSKIEVIHSNGTRAQNTSVWSGEIPQPPAKNKIKSGMQCPKAWQRGHSLIIKVDGKKVRTIPWK